MLTPKEGELAVIYARAVAEGHVQGDSPPTMDLPAIFDRPAGAFVTIHTYPDEQLRGCIGVPEPVMSLREAIRQGAESATHDPRFSPITTDEFDDILVEVTVLTPPQKIASTAPDELLAEIVIGRDGLIAQQGPWRGLLLPQVPVDQGWNVEEYLSHTCVKAGLPSHAWRKGGVTFYRFEGEVYVETTPHGAVIHQDLHEAC